MLERFVEQTHFTSQEDFIANFKVKVPENFNFGYDVVDAWAAEQPDKNALLWTNDKGEHIQFTYADLKKYTDMTASYFQSQGIGHGDKVMLILKRRYEFWFSGSSGHPGYTLADKERYCLSLSGCRYQDDCGCR